MLIDLLGRGYFPKEVPDPFDTTQYATVMSSSTAPPSPISWDKTKGSQYISRPAQFNLARAGTLRRPLEIINPINFYHIAKIVADNWTEIENHLNNSSNSLSRPKYDPNSKRTFIPKYPFKFKGAARLENMSGAKYALIADISQCYHEIYTHSIPWALHGKDRAKSNRNFSALLGNKIDQVNRCGRSGQTNGISIGPDTSLVIAEIILSAIDAKLQKIISDTKWWRYLDDYEFYFATISEAESALGCLQDSVEEFELQLNPKKTRIVELPIPITPKWVRELRYFQFRKTQKKQETDLYDYFDNSLEYWRQYPEEGVISYAVKKTFSLDIHENNWYLYQQLLLQWAMAEPNVLPLVVVILKAYKDRGRIIYIDEISDSFSAIVDTHVGFGHSSEISWILWGCLLFRIVLNMDSQEKIAKMIDPIVAILFLHLKYEGLTGNEIDLLLWEKLMNYDELNDRNWILAYEAYIKGWLPSNDGSDYIEQNPGFKFLRDNNVCFYDETKLENYQVPVQL